MLSPLFCVCPTVQLCDCYSYPIFFHTISLPRSFTIRAVPLPAAAVALLDEHADLLRRFRAASASSSSSSASAASSASVDQLVDRQAVAAFLVAFQVQFPDAVNRGTLSLKNNIGFEYLAIFCLR